MFGLIALAIIIGGIVQSNGLPKKDWVFHPVKGVCCLRRKRYAKQMSIFREYFEFTRYLTVISILFYNIIPVYTDFIIATGALSSIVCLITWIGYIAHKEQKILMDEWCLQCPGEVFHENK